MLSMTSCRIARGFGFVLVSLVSCHETSTSTKRLKQIKSKISQDLQFGLTF